MPDEFDEKPWADHDTMYAVETATRMGVPARSLAIYSRWWQLETWLRDLVYVELRARYGIGWEKIVEAAVGRGPGRQSQDANFTHMHGADTANLLAYLDYSQLLTVVASQWNLFEPSLLQRQSWDGRQEDLKRVRHRIGHVRSPHADDLARVEQVLRDLERGSFIAVAAYNRRYEPDASTDPVIAAWSGSSSTNGDLIVHADRQYDVTFMLRASKRPWAGEAPLAAGSAGVLWHAEFLVRTRRIDLQALWNDVASVRSLVVHLLVDSSSIGFTFSAVDNADGIIEAIRVAFSSVLSSTHRRRDDADWEVDARGLERRARSIDFRVLGGTAWNVVGDDTLPISAFGAGGGVRTAPSW